MISPTDTSGLYAGIHNLQANQAAMNQPTERLATGLAVNSGKDSPSRLIAGEHLTAALRALDAESRSIEREVSRLSAKDAVLAEAGAMAEQMAGLAVQAANTGAMTDAEREALDIEAASLAKAMSIVTASATFGGEKLFDESLTGTVGNIETEVDGESVSYAFADIGQGVQLSDDPGLAQQIAEEAVTDVATMRAEIGAEIAHDLDPRSRMIGEQSIQLSQARSILIDADYAAESSALVRAEGLLDASRFTLLAGAERAGIALDLLA